jgi:aspartate carbamoyltransferase catalytic subunit
MGTLEDKHVVIVGDVTHSRVFRSNVLLLTKLGAHVTVVAPPTLMPAGVTAGRRTPGFETTYDLDEVLPEADAVMMLRVQRERMSGAFFPSAREYTVGYGLTRNRLACSSRTSDLPPGTDEPWPRDRRRRRRRGPVGRAGAGLRRPGDPDGRALPPAGRGHRGGMA